MNAYIRRNVVTEPGAEPIATADAKAHIRVDISDDDTYIGTLIKAARVAAEMITNRTLITTSLRLTYDRFPCRIKLLYGPIQSVTHIKYYDTAGVQQTLSASNYQVDTESDPGRIVVAQTAAAWPSLQSGKINAVEVEYVAGYGTAGANVPQDIIHAMMLMIGHWYENREQVIIGTTTSELPFAAKLLLSMKSIPEQV
jgi:uncharacterized phiE125 gp8 family phage protein